MYTCVYPFLFLGVFVDEWILYRLIGGLDPARSLSVMLDVGTDNEKLLNDELYVVCLISLES